MNYYWLIPRDHPGNVWVFRNEEPERVRVRPQFEHLQCPRCSKFDEFEAIRIGFGNLPPVQSRVDWVAVCDRFHLVSQNLVDCFEQKGLKGVDFRYFGENTSRLRYYLMLPLERIAVDEICSGIKRTSQCQVCGRFREVVGTPRVQSLTIPADARDIIMSPEIAVELTYGRSFRYLASEHVVACFKTAKLKGFVAIPAE